MLEWWWYGAAGSIDGQRPRMEAAPAEGAAGARSDRHGTAVVKPRQKN